nr:DUF2254 family protein [Pseudarthrobacter sp. NBSH8]
MHVIGHLSVLLCRLAGRSPGPEHLTDDAGRVRVVVSLPELHDLLDMAMNQPRQYGAADPRASRPPPQHHRSRRLFRERTTDPAGAGGGHKPHTDKEPASRREPEPMKTRHCRGWCK